MKKRIIKILLEKFEIVKFKSENNICEESEEEELFEKNEEIETKENDINNKNNEIILIR